MTTATATNPAEHSPSAQQVEIFDWFRNGLQDNLVVRARAGTGKTSTIVAGICFAPERAILLAAFNKSIATEMQNRVKLSHVECKTLHALGFKYIVKYSGWKVQLDDTGKRAKDLSLRAEPEAPEAMLRLINDLHTKAREIEPFVALRGSGKDLMGLAVQFNIMPGEEWEKQGWDTHRICDAAFLAMKYAMEKTALIDFADMIFLPLVNKWVRPWYTLVVVDEAQDMTTAQLALALGACRKDGRICIVGDDKQAIYAFRGADSSSLDRLKRQLNARELGLTITYRCASLIVDLAKTLVPDFTAAPGAPLGEIKSCDRDVMIASAVVGDFIISRTNAPLVKVCMALLKRGVRAKVKGREIGRGIIALVRKLKATSVEDLLAKVQAWGEKECEKALAKMPEHIADERCAFVQDQMMIIEAMADDATSVTIVEDRCVNLFADDSTGAVICSSVHKVKGLESKQCWLLEGTFMSHTQEEMNIRYVAITRAKSTLNWVRGFERPKAATAA